MRTFLELTGIAFWTLAAIYVLLLLINSRRGRWLLGRPQIFPYSKLLGFWCTGWIGAVLSGLRLCPEQVLSLEVIRARCSVTLRSMKQLRDSWREVDQLPTIATGKRALGLESVFDIPTQHVHWIKSPYTHPLQTPPYYLPGVPAKTFYDRGEFEWVEPLEAGYSTIRGELMQLLKYGGAGFRGYMNEEDRRMAGWNTFNLFFHGEKYAENCRMCPKTTAVLESLPRFEKDHIMFSALNAHAQIPAHTGPMNGIIRAHLPLIVPAGCYIKVGEDERSWEEGKVLVFDDSFVHQVWNHSDDVRIVMFINFWHPCFSPEEIPVLERFRTAYERLPLSRVHAKNQAQRRTHDMDWRANRGMSWTIGDDFQQDWTS